MQINPYKFPFIALEGIDGCGKSLQVGRLLRWLNANTSVDVFLTREPTDGFFGRKIRNIISGKQKMSPRELQILFVKDRKEHRGKEAKVLNFRPVVSDRDFLSTFAYGMAEGLDPLWIFQQHERILEKLFFIPDLMLIIDVEPIEALRRQSEKGKQFDRFEKYLQNREKTREAYLEIPQILKELAPNIDARIKVVNGSPSEKEVFKVILSHVKEIFWQKKTIEL
jgi:dTMP kinase